ncbi:hypothetical protein HCN44_009928 [Aphidius gifuensis]|uniref:DDE Tnp4 domain-containing protein n=1 Tax=Aphidius gifuensis TaxID=684658 RepID=A0A835CU64_APHGI|nr:hypothetical protein HCN44_009928 [Aphidius gifuensis]
MIQPINSFSRQYNPLNDLPDDKFHNHDRVSKNFVRWLCGRVEPHLAHDGLTSTIPTIHQLLCRLRFLAVGSYQESVGQFMDFGLTQLTVSRILSRVSTAIESLEHEFIIFPREEEQRELISNEFEIMAHFPGVIGSIDGTHITNMPPSNEKWAFLNYKRFYSLNVQVTSDSGYSLTPYIVSPYEQVVIGTPQAEFNIRHKHTRCLIERVFGKLKGRWRCLKKERTMHYQPRVASRFLKCCVILHDASIIQRDPAYVAPLPNHRNDINDDINNDDNVNTTGFDYNVELDDELDEGTELREMIVQTYCTDN